MDADEFFNMIFDRLESLLKGTAQESVLKQFFGGEIINQVISKDCPHLSERVEGFFALSIEVKGKKNILESLELFVKGDVLEGDNKYFCDSCKAKVNAVRRSCVNSLPDNLIVHQKRFEFDLELLRRVKLNDYCEFPMTLDMKPYTKEGLLAKESKEGDAKSTPTEPRDDSYYQVTFFFFFDIKEISSCFFFFIFSIVWLEFWFILELQIQVIIIHISRKEMKTEVMELGIISMIQMLKLLI